MGPQYVPGHALAGFFSSLRHEAKGQVFWPLHPLKYGGIRIGQISNFPFVVLAGKVEAGMSQGSGCLLLLTAPLLQPPLVSSRLPPYSEGAPGHVGAALPAMLGQWDKWQHLVRGSSSSLLLHVHSCCCMITV